MKIRKKPRADSDRLQHWERMVSMQAPCEEILPVLALSHVPVTCTARELAQDAVTVCPQGRFRFIRAKIYDNGTRELFFKASETDWYITYEKVGDGTLTALPGIKIPLDDWPGTKRR